MAVTASGSPAVNVALTIAFEWSVDLVVEWVTLPTPGVYIRT